MTHFENDQVATETPRGFVGEAVKLKVVGAGEVFIV